MTLLKVHGDEDDLEPIKCCITRALAEILPKNCQGRKVKWQSKEEIHKFIRTDGILLSIIYPLTYKTDFHNNPQVKTKELHTFPAEETEECKKVVGFGNLDYKIIKRWKRFVEFIPR